MSDSSESASASDSVNIVCHPKGKSKVWKHFGFVANEKGKIANDKKVICRLCEHQLAYSGNTSNLFYHLQKEHPGEFATLRNETSAAATPVTKSKHPPAISQSTMETVLATSTPYAKNSSHNKQLLTATVEFICHGLHAVSTVDDASFRNLLAVADKRYTIPTRTNFSRKLIPEKYMEVRAQVQKELESASRLSITTDLWTSQHQHRSYISVTAHFITNDFKFLSRCLAAKEVAEDHNAESLASVLQNVFEDWKITGKVYGATTDNGGNIVNACINHLKLMHMPCVGHTLQLAVKRALEINRVKRALGRCRKCVEHFNKSTKATYKLREKQELLKIPQHALAQDCITRWGSTLHMLQRLQEQQAAIAATLMESKDTHLMPEGSEWKVIDQLVEILTPFNLATETMSGEKYPTISMIIPLLHKLLNVTLKIHVDDDTCTKEIKEAISNDLCSRYQSTTIQKLLKVATYLDPRCKSLPFLSNTEKNFVVEDLEDYLSVKVPMKI